MNNIHQKLLDKYKVYYNWHQHSHHVFWHWTILSSVTFGAFIFVFGYLFIFTGDYNRYLEDTGVSSAQAATLNIPITIQEALPAGVSGISRNSEPVTVGIPLEENADITSISQIGLSGANIGQFRILARWPNGNIKWVLVDTQATVSAGGQTSVTLTTGSGNFGGNNLATDNGSNISINTGLAQFTVKKANFNILDNAIINGQTLVTSGNSGRLVMRDANNKEYWSSYDSSSTATIEENGPVKTTIKAEGSFKDSSGARLADYTLRLHFYKNKSYVKSNITLRNAKSNFTSDVLFNSVEAIVPTSISPSTVEFARKTDTITRAIAAGDTAYLYQGFSVDKRNLFSADKYSASSPIDTDCNIWDPPVPGTCSNGWYSYTSSASGLEVKAGSTVLNSLGNSNDWTQGFSELRDSSGKGVTLAMRWMSSFWPASFEFKGDGSTSIEMFSKRNSKTSLKFGWGKHEGREILWDFHTSTANNQAVLYNLQYPLIAKADYSHYQKSKAFYNQSELVTAQQQAQFVTDGGSSQYSQSYSNPTMNTVYRVWWWSMGSGANQTDFPLGQLHKFLASGNPGFYLLGQQRTQFNDNTAVYHSDDFTYDRSYPGLAGTHFLRHFF